MRIDVPFSVTYEVKNATPIEDVIESLVSLKLLIEEGGYSLPYLIAGLEVEQVQVRVSQITQESPLKEVLMIGIYLAVQKDLEREVPALFEKITGIHAPDEFKTILTISVLVTIFYGVAYVKDLMAARLKNSRIEAQLRNLTKDLANRTGKTEEEVQRFLDERYKPKGKIKLLSEAAYGFFKPSKAQSNAPIEVNDRTVTSDVISDVPPDYSYEEVLSAETAKPHYGIQLELHAQDRDRDSSGWAAVPQGITDKRLKMKLLDGVTPSQLWGRNTVRGDIVVKYKRTGFDIAPTEIHLTRIHDS